MTTLIFVHPTSIKPLRTELLGTTALVPTQHKGGGLKAVIGIAAAIAIPFAAPVIASSIGLSATIGATMGSALVGAGLGAATAGLMGGNMLMGAAGGAIGGGIAGYSAGAGAAAGGAGTGAGPVMAAPPPNALGGMLPTPPPQALGGMLAVPPANVLGGVAPGFQGATTGTGSLVNATTAPASTAGTTLSGGAGPVMTPPPANALGGVTPTPSFLSQAKAGLNTMGTNISSAVSNFKPTEAMLQAAGKGATQLLTSASVKAPDMSPEERNAMARRDQARAEQARLSGKKEAAADTYMQAAANINPEYYGQQALTEEQNRLQRAQQAGLRAIAPADTGSRAATIRRNALDKARLGAYSRGANTATQRRLQYMQAAQATRPTGAGLANAYASDLAAADTRYDRLQKERENAQGIFEPLMADVFSVSDKEKRDKQALGGSIS